MASKEYWTGPVWGKKMSRKDLEAAEGHKVNRDVISTYQNKWYLKTPAGGWLVYKSNSEANKFLEQLETL